ncbi:MAG: heme o synthase [Gammaproteobacteria bacterium]|nr:heme o synthase [Gammaproteobacteria bacterium]MDH5241569.1 heme o synthase [Gammaproteobacteria bacterium]MDH5262536.1 heme o synthase [Gammaproteobacteria bacterium]MDH5583807.1 heme o synthase [Gammaproteobacteria bacterium]
MNTNVETYGDWRDYYELTKPRVVLLIVFTAIVGMFLSVPGLPDVTAMLLGTIGIGMASSSAAVFNHVLDARTDILMMRTRGRPLPQGRLTEKAALTFASVLCVISMIILWFLVNPLTAILTFMSLIGYAVVYTVWLKRATPQNIVIGGAAGAAPPVLGWTAITNEVTAGALLLFLIVFVWTPPHFWALAIARLEEYRKVDIPMLPVTHGVAYTRLNILLYSILLLLVTVMPYLIGMSGLIYLIAALGLGVYFLSYAIRMYRDHQDEELPMQMFRYSIAYLGYLFTALLVDHYFLYQLSFQGLLTLN